MEELVELLAKQRAEMRAEERAMSALQSELENAIKAFFEAERVHGSESIMLCAYRMRIRNVHARIDIALRKNEQSARARQRAFFDGM